MQATTKPPPPEPVNHDLHTQSSADTLPRGLYVLTGQAVQLCAAPTSLYEPDQHSVQFSGPSLSLNSPGGQNHFCWYCRGCSVGERGNVARPASKWWVVQSHLGIGPLLDEFRLLPCVEPFESEISKLLLAQVGDGRHAVCWCAPPHGAKRQRPGACPRLCGLLAARLRSMPPAFASSCSLPAARSVVTISFWASAASMISAHRPPRMHWRGLTEGGLRDSVPSACRNLRKTAPCDRPGGANARR
jgi:hypothetical protein